MTIKRVLQILPVFLCIFACIVPIAILIGVPIAQEWITQQSIKLPDDAKYMFDSLRQFSGNYKQKSLYYWSQKSTSEVRQFYQPFTMSPFVEVNSYEQSWLISVWNGSNTIKNPVRKVSQIPADFCDYHEVFDCMSVALFDTSQISLPKILDGMYSASIGEVQSVPNSGTLIVFSYFIPDLA